ncbi:YvcK family protein [Candidatus Bathyarchaeota archaeon]|nr:YvcK family protein [Candidatus Bathyarchaeota archaeon]
MVDACPGIGDVRSRLVRLIPESDSPETTSLRQLFNHRLPKKYDAARTEWASIVEGTHPLWDHMSSPKRELIRSFLNGFNLEAVKRSRPSSRFDYSGASVGNLFLTGARLYMGSFEAAIHLFSSVCGVSDKVSVLPALNTNFASHIAAGLANGEVITGQNDISHPSAPTAAVPGPNAAPWRGSDTEEHDSVEDANLPGSLPALRKPAIEFSKEDEEELGARIERVWYINPYGQEIRIPANPRVVSALRGCGSVIYSVGSLFTSLIPNLVLRGVGDVIATSAAIRNKILLLNGSLDRETGPKSNPFSALDFVAAIANACSYSRGRPPPEEDEYSQYVTHVVYLESEASPEVDRERLSLLGIDTLRLYGPRKAGEGGRYDAKGLMQVLEAVVGRKDVRLDRSRRNTLVG